jgi:hypothetical protein
MRREGLHSGPWECYAATETLQAPVCVRNSTFITPSRGCRSGLTATFRMKRVTEGMHSATIAHNSKFCA